MPLLDVPVLDEPLSDKPSLDVFERANENSLLGSGKLATLDACVQRVASIDGAVAEVGVYRGGSALLIAMRSPEKAVYLFDTFAGMPFAGEGDVHGVGDFGDTSLEAVQRLLADCPSIAYRQGLFPGTTSGLENENFSFVHIDGDQYQTTLDALEFFYPRMSADGIMLFDDYLWPRCPGVERALRGFMDSKPEQVTSPGEYQAMIVKEGSRTGTPASGSTSVPVKTGKHLELHVALDGIGDAICGMYAACGALDTGYEVTLRTKHNGWFSRVREPGLTIKDYARRGIDISARYREHLRDSEDRKQWYCDNIEPGLTPRAPHLDRRLRKRHIEGEYVLLSPFAAFPGRRWPVSHWRYLIKLLHDEGISCFAVDSPGDGQRLRDAFGDTPSAYRFQFAWGHSEEWIADAMLGARCVVGTDSGMTHFAGMLGIATVAIHSQLPPSLLWSQTDIIALTPQTNCTFCRWLPQGGYTASCDAGCSAMASVTPEEVAAKVLQAAGREQVYA